MEPRQASQQVVLFLTHRLGAEIVREFDKLARAVEPFADALILYHHVAGTLPDELEHRRHYVVSDPGLAELGYPMFCGSLVPGSAHFPLLRFFRDSPSFQHYWLLEFDVRFSGSWERLFGSFREAEHEFITCRIRSRAEQPQWPWWDLSHPTQAIPPEERLASLNVIFRISGAALAFLDQMHREGWSGHNEVLLPTLLRRGGFRIRDFGGRGRFVAPGDENRFYIDRIRESDGRLLDLGTVRARPPFRRVGWRRGKLYHPVKPDGAGTETVREELARRVRRLLRQIAGGISPPGSPGRGPGARP